MAVPPRHKLLRNLSANVIYNWGSITLDTSIPYSTLNDMFIAQQRESNKLFKEKVCYRCHKQLYLKNDIVRYKGKLYCRNCMDKKLKRW